MRCPALSSLAISGCVALCAACASQPAPRQPPVRGASVGAQPLDTSRLGRADFNRRAVEVAEPLFWRSDVESPGTLEPDELAVTWSHILLDRAELVRAGAGFTSAFAARYERLLQPDPVAGLAPMEIERRAAVRRELAQGRPTLLESDFSAVSSGERRLAWHLERAAILIERLYARQKGTWGLEQAIPAGDAASAALFFRNQGPACVAPLTASDPACSALADRSPVRVGVYPGPLQSQPEFCAALAREPNAAELRDHFSVVAPGEAPGSFRAVPYSEAWRDDMLAVARELRAAASGLGSEEAALARYLAAAAQAFGDNDWEPANESWRAMRGASRYYLRVAPDEVGFDPCAWKAGFALTFARIDQSSVGWQRRLDTIRQPLEDELAALAGPPYRARRVGFAMPDFIEIILAAGDARLPLAAIGGQSLPNWGPTAERGGRTLVMTNVQINASSLEARAQQMGAVYCPATLRRARDERDLLVLGTVLHEAAHNLGPSHGAGPGGQVDSVTFGGARASLLEELKARAAELYLPTLLVERGLLAPEQAEASHVREVASAFALVAEGTFDGSGKPRSSGQIAAIELGQLRASGALVWHAAAAAGNGRDRGCFELDFERFRPAVTALMREVLQIKARGDRRAAEALVRRWVGADDEERSLRGEVAARWLRTPKASFVYSIRGASPRL